MIPSKPLYRVLLYVHTIMQPFIIVMIFYLWLKPSEEVSTVAVYSVLPFPLVSCFYNAPEGG